MAIAELKWPWLGVAVPCFLIGFIGYLAHFFVFRHYFSTTKQVVFEVMLSMVWLSYYLAVVTEAGSPPANFQYEESRLVWRKYCKKCRNYKPERCHHCKTCKRCVLKMDHHCPWTMNCVGYENLPHFMRFLIWVLIATSFVCYELSLKLVDFYDKRNLPAYLFDTKELVFVIVLMLLDSFVLLTIVLLAFRIVSNQFFSGMTQIEVWDYERLESQIRSKRLWRQVHKNYRQIHARKLNVDKLVTSDNFNYQDVSEEGFELRNLNNNNNNNNNSNFEAENDEDDYYSQDKIPQNFNIDDIVFPYDISFTRNIYNCLGPWYLFWWPWSKPPHNSTQNGLVYEIDPEFKDLDQLSLPWPPDSGSQEILSSDAEYYEQIHFNNQRRRIKLEDPKLKLQRTEWYNDFGEKLSDFGVDLDAEDDDNDGAGSTR